MGKRHIFLGEGTRQQLELLRTERRNSAATLIQSSWRGFNARKRWPTIKRNLLAKKQTAKLSNPIVGVGVTNSVVSIGNRPPRPQPISGTPPPELSDPKIIQQTCTLFGLNLVRT